jgi:cytochrome c oxidase subunit 3
MWLFVISDSLTFSTLLVVYTFARLSSPNWPTPFEFSPSIVLSTAMTLILLSSSLTMVLAVRAINRNSVRATVAWLLATMLCGGLFIGLHLSEWITLIGEGVTPGQNPWGAPLFGATFFGLTGLHMLHVAIGIVYLGIVAGGVFAGIFSREDVEVGGLYWHFVDLVWMFIFPLVYLMSAMRME